MRAILALGLAASLSIYSQSVSGIVVDTGGKPIEGVRVDHISMRYTEIVSDRDGHFSFDFQGPSVVFRKPGYQSQFVRKSTVTNLRIVLQAEAPKEFATRNSLARYQGVANDRLGLHFPTVKGITASKPGTDVDYTARSYWVKSNGVRKGIRHGTGPTWTLGIPDSSDVWQSVDYSETTLASGFHDARGKTAAGKFWRYLGTVGESAAYRDVDESTARILDKVLDGACLVTYAH